MIRRILAVAKGCTVNSFMCARDKPEGFMVRKKKKSERSGQKIVPACFSSLLIRQLTTFLINKAIHDISNLMKRFFGDI